MQGNIRIVLTLSILKNKNTVTTDRIENKINHVHNSYLCFIEFKVGNWSEKNLLALFGIVCQYVISTGAISNTSILYINLSQLLQNY